MPQNGARETAEQGLTLAQLAARVGPRSGATVETIESILRDEVRRGRAVCANGRYVLTGLDPETREAAAPPHADPQIKGRRSEKACVPPHHGGFGGREGPWYGPSGSCPGLR